MEKKTWTRRGFIFQLKKKNSWISLHEQWKKILKSKWSVKLKLCAKSDNPLYLSSIFDLQFLSDSTKNK